MEWYYADGGQQAGPVSEQQLEELFRNGRILADTQVWRQGMEGWQPLRAVKPELTGPAATGANPIAAPTLAADEVVCTECGKVFKVNDTIQYGTVRVCAACKPVFMQKLAEGVRIGGGLKYASFGVRFGAYFLDGVILYVVNTAISLLGGLSFAQTVGASPNAELGRTMVLLVIQLGVNASYEVFMIGKFGATLGKMACKIRVVTADGGRVSYARALGRYFGKLLSALPCLIGYIMAAFDDEKRALHDRICNTRVIMKN